MGDRLERYASLLVDRALDVQPGWQVLVRTSPLARPLHEAVVRAIARRGAYALTRLSFADQGDLAWQAAAPEELVGRASAIAEHEAERVDALVSLWAPENVSEASAVSPERTALRQRAAATQSGRTRSLAIPWVVCQFPTPALAQAAGMSLRQFEEFLYGAVLRDWEAEGRRMARIAERFDRGEEVRIVGPGTDLTLSIAGRTGHVSQGYHNLPDGEVFFSPVEDSAEGVIAYSEFPATLLGNHVEGVRLRFERGRVVEASATANEGFLLKTLDTDEGARRLGELGIGCNPGIQRHMRNTLFDEKMDGTVHLAVGASYTHAGGKNESAIHWDMVKDLREGGRLFCDGELVQENGAWLI